MNRRCPNIQDIVLCDCIEDQCSIREQLNCHYSGLASVKSYDVEQDKEEQKKLIKEIMDADAKDGLYEEDKTFKQKSKWTKVKKQTELLTDITPTPKISKIEGLR